MPVKHDSNSSFLALLSLYSPSQSPVDYKTFVKHKTILLSSAEMSVTQLLFAWTITCVWCMLVHIPLIIINVAQTCFMSCTIRLQNLCLLPPSSPLHDYTFPFAVIMSLPVQHYCLFFSALTKRRDTIFRISSNTITGALIATTPIHSSLLNGTTENILAKNGV